MSTLEWKRLGYFSFDSNERSRFEARELKSVYLNTTAAALKLVVHAPLTNNLNVYNQIGVVAVTRLVELRILAAISGRLITVIVNAITEL